ncbi:MAG: glycosyltransferase family 1 protein [Anaerolineae bacterium]|nr:glycosyltransferase family 1 protein [Anaerolineae bacterium]
MANRIQKSSTTIIQFVPRLLPVIDGVGDYALNLARQLREDFDIHTQFIVGDPTWKGASQIEGFPIHQIEYYSDSSFVSTLTRLEVSVILLHYVGYGYAKRGCPLWLIKGLQQWQIIRPQARLITMFHEVYAAGRPPWTSAFWLFPLQKQIAGQLVQLSRQVLTSKQLYAEILSRLSPKTSFPIPTLPVFSNVGEPKLTLPLAERDPTMVVFGGRAKRRQVYLDASKELDTACQKLNLTKILDIGPAIDLDLSDNFHVPVIKMGKLPAADIGDLLQTSRAGFLVNRADYLAKSGIFAAYCANGLLPVVVQSNTTIPVDGIEPEKHYWSPNAQNGQSGKMQATSALQAIATNAYCWYQAHSLPEQAKMYSKYLTNQVVE